MSEDQFTKLFNYMEGRFSDMDARFEQIQSMFGDLQSLVDGYAKQLVELNQEHLMLSHKVDRNEQQLHKVAKKTGVRL